MSDFSARRVVLAGASGLIGRALAESLRGDGVEVHTLVRRAPQHPTEHAWDPYRGPLDPAVLAGARAVVGLGGDVEDGPALAFAAGVGGEQAADRGGDQRRRAPPAARGRASRP